MPTKRKTTKKKTTKKVTSDSDSEILTTKQVADLLSVNPKILRKWAREETFPEGHKLTERRFYWFKHEIIAWLKKK